MSKFPIRKHCSDCSIEYEVVSGSNWCKKCKNKLTIEFDMALTISNIVYSNGNATGNMNDTYYTTLCYCCYDSLYESIIYKSLDASNCNTLSCHKGKKYDVCSFKINYYNYAEKINNLCILESIYQEELSKEKIYMKCNLINKTEITFMLTNKIDKTEIKYYEEIELKDKFILRCTAEGKPFNKNSYLPSSGVNILKVDKIYMIKPIYLWRQLLKVDVDTNELNTRINLITDEIYKTSKLFNKAEIFNKYLNYIITKNKINEKMILKLSNKVNILKKNRINIELNANNLKETKKTIETIELTNNQIKETIENNEKKTLELNMNNLEETKKIIKIIKLNNNQTKETIENNEKKTLELSIKNLEEINKLNEKVLELSYVNDNNLVELRKDINIKKNNENINYQNIILKYIIFLLILYILVNKTK